MARKRAFKKRVDYRNGGRVRAWLGSFGMQSKTGKYGGKHASGPSGGASTGHVAPGKTQDELTGGGTGEAGEGAAEAQKLYEAEQKLLAEMNAQVDAGSKGSLGNKIKSVPDMLNPFDKSYPVVNYIRDKAEQTGRQVLGSNPGDALALGYSSQEGVAAADAGSGYDQTGFAGEQKSGSSLQSASQAPPKPKREDYAAGMAGTRQWTNDRAEWETRYGTGQTSDATVDKKVSQNLLKGPVMGVMSRNNSGTVGMSDPAEGQLVSDLGGEAYVPPTATVDKLGTGAITEQSSDAEKLKAGISTDVQAIDKDNLTDATAGTATAGTATATAGTAGTADTPADYDAATYTATTAGTTDPTIAAQGEVSKIAEAEGPEFRDRNRVETARRDALAEEQAMAQKQDFTISDDAFVDKVTGKVAEVVQTDPAEKQQREVQLGMPAPDGEAAQIINKYGFGRSMGGQQRILKGAKAKQEAAAQLATDHDLDPEVANQIMEDVEGFRVEDQSQESLGAVAALPKEALVSTQIENLVSGMEEGKPPSWARPAVAAVEQMMAARGLSASTVGRDALFNAIIQSAIPLAQSNATALQQRAAQNLSNEQQALMQDRQIAASFLEKNAAFKQQMELANLSNDQQMRLANLTSRNQNESENLSAAQQTEMANLNARLQTNLTSAKIAATMNQAQLSVDQQRAVANATMVANVDMAKFNAGQQVELANSKFMQNATLTDFNARQQSAMQNATTMAQMDLAAADQRTKLAITNANNFLQMDMANLNNRQQGIILDQQLKQQRLLSDQSAANAAKQFNATSQNQTNQFLTNLEAQMNQFNTSQSNAMEQFNKAEANRISAINAQNETEVSRLNAQLATDVSKFNAQQDFQAEMWNKQNAQAVEQSNINWRRKSNTIDSAAQNAANMMNAQQSFAMDSAEQNFLWQQARDKATYLRQAYENEEQRKTTLYATALASEGGFEGTGPGPESLVDLVSQIFNGPLGEEEEDTGDVS
jgi:hypothetical protein